MNRLRKWYYHLPIPVAFAITLIKWIGIVSAGSGAFIGFFLLLIYWLGASALPVMMILSLFIAFSFVFAQDIYKGFYNKHRAKRVEFQHEMEQLQYDRAKKFDVDIATLRARYPEKTRDDVFQEWLK